MQRTLFTALFICCTGIAIAQHQATIGPGSRPAIDTSAFSRWLSVKTTIVDMRLSLTNDGNYILYRVRENWNLPSTILIRSTSDTNRSFQVIAEDAIFSSDSRKAIFLDQHDSLCILDLNRFSGEYLPGVASFQLFRDGKTEWLAWLTKPDSQRLHLRNLGNGKELYFENVSWYQTAGAGKYLAMKITGPGTESLWHLNLGTGERKNIWNGKACRNIVLNGEGDQLAFQSDTPGIVWTYRAGASVAKPVQLHLPETGPALGLVNINGFSRNGKRLFVLLTEQAERTTASNGVQVDVWSYTDPQIQEQQLEQLKMPAYQLASLDPGNGQCILLQQKNEWIDLGIGKGDENWMLLNSARGEPSEWNWNKTAYPSYLIVNKTTGERRKVDIFYPMLMLNEDFVIGLSEGFRDIISYEIATGLHRNLTASIPVQDINPRNDEPYRAASRGFIHEGFAADGRSIIVSDEYDLWQIDPSGRTAPMNITRGLGRKQNLSFHLTAFDSKTTEGITLPDSRHLVLWTFDYNTGHNGFYRLDMKNAKGPELIHMGPYYFDPGYNGICQVKAKDAGVYAMMREDASASPNYFLTKDFKTYHQVSDVHPERAFNWMSSELISFPTLDGRMEKAAIYRPEDFDPNKRYPLIIHYYDRKTQELNQYHRPGAPNGDLDIPWFTSHGYVVVTPDIHFRIGAAPQSALNTVLGCAKHMVKYPWIDSARTGIQGHSLGGYLTNYIVTKTNFFSAAIASSGMSDLVSNYLGFLGNHSNFDWYENRICRIGATLWERPDTYIQSSPVFEAMNVNTPILTVANKKDVNVYFEQGVEWFMALRRLGKRAWMLQYDRGSHGLGGNELKDYVLRSAQFFDHYLKGARAPVWMTRGIPASKKGIITGLEPDDSSSTPGKGLLP